MQKIWKYEVRNLWEHLVPLRLPKGSKIQSVMVQAGRPVVYSVVELPATSMETRYLKFYATGETFQGGEYIGTVELEDKKLVFHVYEVRSAS
jgi:hypothetical protein